MCDLLPESEKCPIISTTKNYEEKEKLSQNVSDDDFAENTKDSAPELLVKTDNYNEAVPAKVLEKLTRGILCMHEDDIQKFSTSLSELQNNQSIVIETMQQETKRLSDALSIYPLDDTFSRIELYLSKVQVMKKEMIGIHEKATKLKKRAMRLQQYKQKEALQKELQRDRELERDRQLAPKIVTKS